MLDSQYKSDLITAGKYARIAVEYGASLVKPGASYNTVVDAILAKIKELGAIPAFPPQLALNEVAAHFLPMPGEDIIFKDELVCVDVGVCVNGAIGDCATSVDLSGKYGHIITAANEALAAAVKTVKVGATLSQIGAAIDGTIRSHGLLAVRNLSGHGLGKFEIHTDPTIPNYDTGSSFTIKPGMVFAIEPFATNGVGRIYDAGNPVIFSVVSKKGVRSQFARAVLAKAEGFDGLPFRMHDLVDAKLSLNAVRFGIKELLANGSFMGHAPLVEEGRGMVAQAEHTFLVDDDGTVIVTTK